MHCSVIEQPVDYDKVEPSSIQATPTSLVRPCRCQIREAIPDCNPEREFATQYAHKQSPVVKLRKVSRSSTLLDLDPKFRQRQEERSEKYAALGLTEKSDWRYNQNKIAQSIASTVARMTRNYYSSSDDHIFYYQGTDASQHLDVNNMERRCYGDSFESDLNEAWDSVTVGRHLMREVFHPTAFFS